MNKLTIILEPAESGWWAAHVAEVPGANSQGKSPDEARANVLLALEDLMESYREDEMSKISNDAQVVSIELKSA